MDKDDGDGDNMDKFIVNYDVFYIFINNLLMSYIISLESPCLHIMNIILVFA